MPRALTIGTFDGVHRGHQALIQRCLDLGDCVAVTFDPHPRQVLGQPVPPLIQTLEDRMDWLERHGASEVEVLPFAASIATQSFEQFLLSLLSDLSFDVLVLGSDARLGAGRAGSVEAIREFGERQGFAVESVDPVIHAGQKISSSRIREEVGRGELASARELLGRPFSVSGHVLRGAGRGAAMGFPTANLQVHGRLMPPAGVYAGWARIEDLWIPAVMNYGAAPTFDRPEQLLEVHLLEGSPHLLGRRIEAVPFLRLRGQQRFGSREELQQQLARDRQMASSWSSGIQIDLPS